MTEDALDGLHALCFEYGYDYGIRVEVGLETAWSAEIRVTREPNRVNGPDRSLVTFVGGEASGEEAIEKASAEMILWLGEST